jgi:hypothetical protein
MPLVFLFKPEDGGVGGLGMSSSESLTVRFIILLLVVYLILLTGDELGSNGNFALRTALLLFSFSVSVDFISPNGFSTALVSCCITSSNVTKETNRHFKLIKCHILTNLTILLPHFGRI